MIENGLTDSMNDIVKFTSRREMARDLADQIAQDLKHAINERGTARLALSGGSTPAGLYRELSLCRLDWTKVETILVDERWVPANSDGSNECFIRDTLQQNNASEMILRGMWRDDFQPVEAARVASTDFEKNENIIDVVILGMGEDGHTASWFPFADNLNAALSPSAPAVMAITANKSDVTGEFLQRLTLTLRSIASARRIILLLAGQRKLDVLEKAFCAGRVEEMPIRAILNARPDMQICWTP